MKPTKLIGERFKERRLTKSGDWRMMYVYPTDAGNMSVLEIAKVVGKTPEHVSIMLQSSPEIVFGPKRKPGPVRGSKYSGVKKSYYFARGEEMFGE